jgi:hypothetical protein
MACPQKTIGLSSIGRLVSCYTLGILVGMKKALFVCLIVGLPCLSFGYELPTEDELKGLVTQKALIEMRDLKCKTVLDIAELVMKGRQSGITIDKQLQQLLSYTTMPADLVEKERELIVEAYKLPQFESKRDQYFITKEYSTKAFLECKKNGL